jgi:hypothetical protein
VNGTSGTSGSSGTSGTSGTSGQTPLTASYITQSSNIFSFATQSQSIAVANTFQDIIYNTDMNNRGWTHPANSGNFTSSFNAVYNVRLSTFLQRPVGTTNVAASRILYNGVEVTGSYASCTITTNNVTYELVSEAIFFISSGSGINAQVAASTSSIQVMIPAVIGTPGSRPSAKIFINPM